MEPENEIRTELKSWLNMVLSSREGWQNNNLHIDEIKFFANIKRSDWLEKSIVAFTILKQSFVFPKYLVPFVHVDLSDSLQNKTSESLTINWINDNLHEFTPPSLNFCSDEYYANFYLKELKELNVRSCFNSNHTTKDFKFYFRSYFDKSENAYSREVYIF